MYHNPNENARKEVKPMKTKHYYCQGRAITREEAEAIDRENEKLLASPDKADWLKIKVVIVQQEEVKKNA